METKLESIRKVCISANPSILDLKFGCKFNWNAITKPFSGEYIVTAINLPTTMAVKVVDTRDIEDGYKFKDSEIYDGKDFEIIGRPIRLADVLVAIKFKRNNFILIDTSGVIAKVKNDRPLEFGERTQWNLLKDDLTLQSKETIEFIYNLIK